jgi:predicted nucleotidyltransferase component of viral defense system
MSIQIIQDRLNGQLWETQLAEQQALREITQEIILAALGRGDFFKHAAFQGGTCLRIFHGLERFSEALDFILREPNPQFDWSDYVNQIKREVEAYGLNFTAKDKSELNAAVKKVFLKEDSLGKLLALQYAPKTGPAKQIRIKLEVDTNPPSGSGCDIKHLEFPFHASVTVQDLPSLFAGKMHALLCRNYVKGRDWYDFLWYTRRATPVNYRFLESALDQCGPWAGNEQTIDIDWVVEHLGARIRTLEIREVAGDVLNFVSETEHALLRDWSLEYFLDRLERWARRQA